MPKQWLTRTLAAFMFLLMPAVAQPPGPLGRLRANIERIMQTYGGQWGFYMKCLETGDEIAIHADEQMDTMSVIKIPLMVEAFRQIEAGKFGLNDRVSIQDSQKLPGTGIIKSLDGGVGLTIHDLLT